MSRYHLPAAFLFFFVGVTLGFTIHYVMAIIFVSFGMVFLFFNYVYTFIRKKMTPHTVSAKQPKNSIFGILFTMLMKKSFFIKLDNDIRNTILSRSVSIGELQNPRELSRKIIIAFVCSVPISAIISIVGAVMLQQIYFLALLTAPLFILLVPRVSNMLRLADTVSNYDADLAYFLSYLHISHLGQTALYHSMIRLSDCKIFPAIERDVKIIQRWVDFDGITESMAINQLANRHANKTFQSFLFAYFDISKSNPRGLDDFIAKAASTEFERTISADEKAVGKISTIFVFGGIALIMVPALLIMMSFAVPDAEIIEMVSMMVLVLPLGFTALSLLMYRKKSDFDVSFAKISLLGILLAIPCYAVTLDVLISLSLGVGVTCLWNGMIASRQISAVHSTVNGFVPFVRDLIERRKVDSNFVTSLKKIFLYDMEKKYGRFSYVLRDINNDMNVFSDKKQDIFFNHMVGSERLNMMMFVLQSIFDGGYKSTISSLERLHSFSEKTISIQNKTNDTLKMSSLLLLFAPMIFFVVLSAISTLMISFTEHVPVIPEGVNVDASAAKFFEKFDTSAILSAMRPAIFVMSVCSGIVISRVAYSSFVATLPMGICLIIALGIFVGWDYFFDIISSIIQN